MTSQQEQDVHQQGVTGLTREGALCAAEAALDKKAQNIILLDVSQLTTCADYFLICSGHSPTQVKAIVFNIEQALKERGTRPLHIEGQSEARWVLMDYDELIIHVFHENAREFYDLERLWKDAPCTTFEDPTEAAPDFSIP
ncbi:ribosome silencing factor [candidate division KSB3 bacterium]|uniref:Ribosomal silencing factor RsfS n=1 Tax=candidate division KSB3 bacterium TaxID=2044937 RepID=A0A2G6E7S9_9BACT|nr:MAG: ribosome silencing factor [candidate division KSB3 bacterium]PIE30247.1 MAG: ribosome silencing factor [candidate division KSB3 bacterium]